MKNFNQISMSLFIANTNINVHLNLLKDIRVVREKTRAVPANFIMLKVGSYKKI